MDEPKRILVIQPSWVGDVVMATPTMRALREQFPNAHITYLCRRYVKAMLVGLPYADRIITYRTGKTTAKTGKGGLLKIASRVRHGKFDTAILLTNSFKTALIAKLAGIKRIVGYDRDGRGFLLTDKLLPYKDKGKYVPSPIVYYYLAIAQYLGSRQRDIRMELRVTPAEAQRARQVLAKCELGDVEKPLSHGEGPLVIINAGAQYGAAKCWLPEHFAAVADRLIEQHGATILLSGTSRERRILDGIQRHMRHAAVDLSNKGLTLGALKEIIRRCDLMITNDTGPRHIAAAFDVPVITIFGPTHPEWTEIYFPRERKVSVKVVCGPCQKKVCPLDHRCMREVTPDMVMAQATELIGQAARAGA